MPVSGSRILSTFCSTMPSLRSVFASQAPVSIRSEPRQELRRDRAVERLSLLARATRRVDVPVRRGTGELRPEPLALGRLEGARLELLPEPPERLLLGRGEALG